MRSLRLSLLLVLCIFAFSCTYQTPIGTVSGINTYSAYDSKIPGRFALVVDANPALLDVTVSPVTYTGSAADFPISFSSSFKTSVYSANQQLFDEIIDTNNVPNTEQMRQDNISGYIHITAKSFEPRIQYLDKFFTTSVSATSEIGFDYIIRGSDNTTLLTGAVSGEKSDTISYGSGDNGIKVLQNSTQKALREALERYAERVSNSSRIRDYLSTDKKPIRR